MIPAEWLAARRVLVIRLDNLGDVLLTTPAIRALRQSLPDASLTLLASEVGAQVGRLDPDLDDVVVYAAPGWTPGGSCRLIRSGKRGRSPPSPPATTTRR